MPWHNSVNPIQVRTASPELKNHIGRKIINAPVVESQKTSSAMRSSLSIFEYLYLFSEKSLYKVALVEQVSDYLPRQRWRCSLEPAVWHFRLDSKPLQDRGAQIWPHSFTLHNFTAQPFTNLHSSFSFIRLPQQKRPGG